MSAKSKLPIVRRRRDLLEFLMNSVESLNFCGDRHVVEMSFFRVRLRDEWRGP